MSGGKGGSTTSSVEIPEYIEAAAQRNLNRAERIGQMGYVPYYGPDVAALTPMQQASMQNVADVSGAFGLAAPTGQDIYGMPEPTEFAGGIRGYSSAPMFEEAQAELARRRPAQKSYIDSFFIDPFTGAAGSNMMAPIDYTQINSAADARRQQQAYDMAMAGLAGTGGVGMAGGSTFTTYGGHRDIAHQNINQAYVDYGKQISAGTAKPEDNPSYNAAIAAANKDRPITFMTDDGRTVTKAAGQLTSADFEVASNDPATQYALAGASMAAAGVRNVGAGFAQDDPTTGVGGAFTDAFGNVVENVANVPGIIGAVADTVDAPTSTYDPTGTAIRTNDNDDDPAWWEQPSFSVGGSTAAETNLINSDISDDDFWAAVESDATVGSAVSGGDDGGNGGSGDDGGCVVATHAVSSGAFTPSMKREAVVWCMHNLHDKWWGEAIRRGYRYLGRKKIEQGKAHEHYQEFRNYIDFASGKKRTIKGAIHFAARTVQFFAVGLVKGDA